MKTWLVTGGAGFIGSTFVRMCRTHKDTCIINLDLLTYAGNLANLYELRDDASHIFVHGDINDRELVRNLLTEHRPNAVVHFAAESHVDRSILGPDTFIRANINGTFALLEEARYYWDQLDSEAKNSFRFHHISTDEVYGSLGPDDHPFTETTAYHPNSPYSASKAASDHLVASYHSTYGLPTLITNCSNNYGPYQFPEKLIPLMITNALTGKPLPVYGDGMNIRDWLFVEDHCEAINRVLISGAPGEMYNIGGLCEMANIDVVNTICTVMDRLFPDSPYTPHESLITYVKDRPGHDRRYAIDASKIGSDLGWTPRETFESGIEKTIRWYIDNPSWIEGVQSGEYRDWITLNYNQR